MKHLNDCPAGLQDTELEQWHGYCGCLAAIRSTKLQGLLASKSKEELIAFVNAIQEAAVDETVNVYTDKIETRYIDGYNAAMEKIRTVLNELL
jgi:hypothetical protein